MILSRELHLSLRMKTLKHSNRSRTRYLPSKYVSCG